MQNSIKRTLCLNEESEMIDKHTNIEQTKRNRDGGDGNERKLEIERYGEKKKNQVSFRRFGNSKSGLLQSIKRRDPFFSAANPTTG